MWQDGWETATSWQSWGTSNEATRGDSEAEQQLQWWRKEAFYFGAYHVVLNTTLDDVNRCVVTFGLSGPQLWVSCFVLRIALEK